MDQGNNISNSITHMGPSNLSMSPNSLSGEPIMTMNVPRATLDVTIDKAISKQAEDWAASRTNFGLNYDQNMDPKKIRRLMLRRIESKRSRLRKKMYMVNLESKAKETEVQIVYNLRPQIESELDQKATLLLEQETIIHRINILEKELHHKLALTEELSAELNVSNELYTMQQEQQAQMLNWNDYNVQPLSYDPLSNFDSNPYDQDIGSNGSQMGTTTVSEEHETNVIDWANIGLMEMFSTPTSSNQFP